MAKYAARHKQYINNGSGYQGMLSHGILIEAALSPTFCVLFSSVTFVLYDPAHLILLHVIIYKCWAKSTQYEDPQHIYGGKVFC